MRNSLKKEVICALVQHLSHFMHFCVGTKKKIFARKVSLEIFDKSRPK